MANTKSNPKITLIFTTDPTAETLYAQRARTAYKDTDVEVVRTHDELENFIVKNKERIGQILFAGVSMDLADTLKYLASAKNKAGA